MNAKLRALLLPILRTVRSGKAPSFRNRSAAEQAIFLLGKPASQRRKRAAAARKASRALEHSESTASIREAVFQRAEGGCEAIYGTEDGAFERCDANAAHLDHWLGGAGRRRQKQSVETCWALCPNCHRLRTNGSTEFWNEIFRRHCEDYGYPVTPHIVHEQMTSAASAPQAPSKALSGDES